MKNRNAVLVFILIALTCAAVITCENSVMEKWWDKPADTYPYVGGAIVDPDPPYHVEGDYYTVVFIANDGEPDPDEQRIEAGKKIAKVTARYNGAKGFAGWYQHVLKLDENGKPLDDDNDGEFDYDLYQAPWDFAVDTVDQEDVDENGVLTLEAQWDTSSYQVQFMDGENPVTEQQVVADGKIIEPPPLIKEGYAFGGWWYNGSDRPWNFTDDTVTGDMILRAKWTPVYFTVKFNAGGASPGPVDQSVAYGETIDEPAAMTNLGSGFAGWYTDTSYKYQWDFATYTIAARDTTNGVLTLYAKWEASPYTVQFDTGGGGTIPDQSIAPGGRVVRVAPVNNGNSGFAGWYTDTNRAVEWDFTKDRVTSDKVTGGIMTLYAKWEPLSFLVRFWNDKNDNNIEDSASEILETRLAPGARVVKAAAAKPDYTFAGWYDTGNGNRWDFTAGTVTRDLTLKAQWTPMQKFTIVTFNAQGGDTTPAPQTIARDMTITEPAAIARTNFGFGGWYTDSACADGNEWDFTKPVTKDFVTLYAKWVQTFYTVQFEANGGSPSPAAQRVATGAKITNVAAMQNGIMVFGGWYTDPEFNYQWNVATYPVEAGDVTNNVLTLYAKWTSQSYTVQFMADDQPAAPSQHVMADNTIIEPVSPVKAGYGFDGWYAQGASARWDFTKPVTGNMILTAKWTQRFYTVHFNAQGGDSTPQDQNIAYNGPVNQPAAITRSGYGFGGWYTDQACTAGQEWDFAAGQVTASIVTNNAITLYAKWVQSIYTVTFIANGGTPAPQPQSLSYNSLVMQPAIMNPPIGKGFVGWYMDAACSPGKEWDFFANSVKQSVTLYAKWEDGRYTLTFDTAGGNMADRLLTQTIMYEGKAIRPRPDPTKTGYSFKGWYTTPAPSPGASEMGKLYNFDDEVGGNLTLHARWVEKNRMMEWIPGGSFNMGGLSGSGSTNRPAHNVTVSGFYILRAEVNQNLFDRLTYWAREKQPGMNPEELFSARYMFDTPEPRIHGFNPSSAKGSQRPVESVTWYDAVYFCNILTDYDNATARSGLPKFEHAYEITNIVTSSGKPIPEGKSDPANLNDFYAPSSITSATVTLNPKADPHSPLYEPAVVGYRLPTEAEWEYAARGGDGSPDGFKWAGSDTPNDVAWYGGSSGNTTTTREGGQKKPTAFGLYDMSGNVCEWVWDWYDPNYYKDASSGNDPLGPILSPSGERSRRGGSIRHSADNCRTQVRDSWAPDKSDNWNIGFRVVRTGEE